MCASASRPGASPAARGAPAAEPPGERVHGPPLRVGTAAVREPDGGGGRAGAPGSGAPLPPDGRCLPRPPVARRASPGLSAPRPTVRPVRPSPARPVPLSPARLAGTAARAAAALPRYEQATIDELGTPLAEVTFVVVDLETTGGSPKDSAITEIGAVKVRGGQVLGEFQTLVDPGREIPPYISVLTGITSMMVAAAPRIDSVLPAFLEFARGTVLVAHNAPFDLGFLRAACESTGVLWPAFASVDTAVLARRLLTRDEVPNCKLATLAPFFRTTTEPCHRALADARATVDVLHGLFERLGPLGVTSLEELTGLTRQVDPQRRRKRHLAEHVPSGPGVYLFRGPRDEPLYVGTSTDLRSRVRSYFTASEQRSRITEMVGIARRVESLPCAHDLEAAVRELRLIAEHKPRYNRRSRFPERALWLRLTDEPFPRLSVVRRVRPGAGAFLGPFPDRRGGGPPGGPGREGRAPPPGRRRPAP